MYGGSGSNGETHNSRLHGSKYQSNYLHGCSWWDVSCLLRWVFSYTSIGGTREPINPSYWIAALVGAIAAVGLWTKQQTKQQQKKKDRRRKSSSDDTSDTISVEGR